MEKGEKQAIIFKKVDKQGNDKTIPLYIIDETIFNNFNTVLKRKEEYHKTFFVNKTLPKDLFQQLENNYLVNVDPIDKFKSEKELQFNIIKHDLQPIVLGKYMDNLKII